MLTLNQIIDQIKTLANAHYQIAEVGVGTVAELQAKPDRLYPLLWLSNEGGTLEDNYKVDNIRLTMFGRVITGEEGQDDDASEIEVLSDMQLILLDFLNYFHQQHGQEYVTDKSASLEHFTERTNDRTAGYSTVLELKQFYDWNKCQIPESGATIPPTVDGLTLYDFCDQETIDRLTPTQIACLEAEFSQCDPVTVQVNSTTVGTPASGDTYNLNIQDSTGASVGTSTNPSVIGDASVTNSDGSYSGSVVAEGSLVLPDITVTDSDGSTSSVPSVQDVVCTPASYGTRIGSLLRRQYCVEAMCSFGFDVLEDEFVGEDSVMLRRDADGVTANYTQTEYEDGVTVEAWLAAGGGTENAAVVVMYDNTGNYFELYNNTANNQALMFIAGVRQVDSNGNTCMVTQNTQGYFIGALDANAQDLPLFTTNGSMWTVAERGTQSGVSRQITASGNPTVGIAQSGSTSSATLSSGTPQYYVNNAALTNNQRGELHAATENVRALTFIETIDFSFSGSWRTNSQINVFNAYPVGSKIHEVVIGKKDWGTSTIRNLIYTNRNAYYNF